MSRMEESPAQRAEREVPKRWYEHVPASTLGTGGVLLTATAVITSTYEMYGDTVSKHPIAAHIAGGALYLASAVADNKSTVKALNSAESARSAGIPFDVEELSPTAPNARTTSEFLAFKRRHVYDALAIVVSSISPLFAVPVSGAKAVGVLNNRRLAHRADHAVKIAKAETDN